MPWTKPSNCMMSVDLVLSETELGFMKNNSNLSLSENIDLHEQAGQPVQIPCDILSYQEEIKWIEWRKSNSTTLLLVKYPNYEVYINPEFSTRLNMDKYGGLIINPLLQQDAATYECKSFMLWDNITAFVHGSSINLKIKGNFER